MVSLRTPPAGRVRDRAVTPKPAGGTFSKTSEAEHLVRLCKWLRDELAGHGVPKQEQSNLLEAGARRKGDVRLCGLQDDVRGIFELTRLARAMSIHPTRQEALASWR